MDGFAVGRPAGLTRHFDDLADALPAVEPDATLTPDDPRTDFEGFTNHGDIIGSITDRCC